MYRTCSLVFLIAACQDTITTPFPPGLEPFEDDAEPLSLDGTVAEVLRTRARQDDRIRVYGRAYIFQPPGVVYATAHDPEVMVARCKTTSQTWIYRNEPEYDLSFLVHYFVDDILNVEWDDQWRGDVIAGELATPEHVMIKHQKVRGSDFIRLSQGTIAMLATDDPQITELRFVEHLDAVRATAGDVTAGMQHNYDALRAVAHGGTIPACP
jgi:hypothetical protein